MSEKRTVQEIQVEYQQNCANLGHVEYQIFALGKDVTTLTERAEKLNEQAESLKEKILLLNKEAAELSKAEAATPVAAPGETI